MYKKWLMSFAFIAALGASFTVAAKKNSGPLSSEMKAYVVETVKGKEVLKASKDAEPGQLIEYQLVYKNTGKGALGGLAVTGPIPSNTTYIGQSAATKVPANFLVSIDGGKTYEKTPVTRMVKNKKGEMEKVVISPQKYTHLRWRVRGDLKAGGKQVYSYRVKVK